MAMPNPVYPSPAVPPMNSIPAYYAGPTPIQYSVPGQPATGYYPPMASMQMGPNPMMSQYPYGYYDQRRCGCCHPDSCCYGL
ncbi:hypothetical protein K501DRAFT_84525 [Backusella circina FSU 941]|nr:hypothetical protein K501DRAFT_84525 [Backusella circina FSU 941]